MAKSAEEKLLERQQRSTTHTPRNIPRSVENDAAFRAAASAFGPASQPEQPPVPSSPPPAAAASHVAAEPSHAADQNETSGPVGEGSARPASVAPVNVGGLRRYEQPTKTSVYPSAGAKQRLKQIRDAYHVGESFVIEAALDDYLSRKTDEEIATELRARGCGLRRLRTIS